MLRLESITKKFGTKKIIDNISMRIEPGEIAILLGGSGVGKSTLLRILNNLEILDSGNVFFNNKKLDLDTINKTHTVGMLFQQFNLFNHMTVIENIAFILRNVMKKTAAQAEKQALALLEKYGLAEKKDARIADLSGGQKQRLALARTLATQPKILCLDEPTSALDPLLTTHIAKTISELAQQNYTIMIATHDTVLLEKLDCTIYLLDQGKIIQSATSVEFFSNQSAYPLIKQFIQGS